MLRTMWMTMALGAGVGLAAHAHAEGMPGVSPAKQALVQRVLDKMGLESVGLQMLQAPVADMLRQSRVVVQSRVPADKQDATMKDITAEATTFVEQESAGLRTSTRAIVQSSVAPLLAQKFSEEELKQLAGILESPVLAKFESVVPEMKKAVGDNVAKANAAQIQPKMTALQNRVGLKLRAAVGQ